MRKQSLLLIILLLVCVTGVQAENKFTALGTNTLGTGMSPNGKYVVGVDSKYFAYNTYIQSYLYNVGTEKLEWITAYDETDLGKSGSFTDVSNDGVISGTYKDPEYVITVSDFDGDFTFPINVAAVWKDGKRTSLGLGSYNLSDFKNFEDGSFADAISGDGKTVVGYIGIGNSTFTFPCTWKQSGNNDWTFSKLALPEGAVGGKAVDVSADGSIIAGVIWYGMYEAAAYWKNGVCHLIKGIGADTQYNEMGVNRTCAVSSNGKYISFLFGYSESHIYDVEQESYKKIVPFEPYHSPKVLAIADNGNVVSSFGYGSLMSGEVYERPFWYSYKDNRLLGFDYFMGIFAPGLNTPFTFAFDEKTKAVPCAISADGTLIMGNNDIMVSLGGTPECWILQSENRVVTIPETPDELNAKSLELKEVTLTWKKDERTYEGLELESYNIYCEGEKITTVPITSAKELTYTHKNATVGFPKYSIASVFKTTGTSTVESPKSNPVATAVPDTYALPLFDDFDSQSLETNYWTRQPEYGDMADTNWGVIPYFGIFNGALYSSPTAQTPYSSGLVSRPMDATKEKNISLSFAINFGLINSENQRLDQDSLSIDVSVDKGASWTEVKTFSFKDIPQSWSMQTADLSKWVAGKRFQVRLRKHGQGVAQYLSGFDLFKVGATPEKDAPQGLTGKITDTKQVNLIWQNTFDAYQLNHINEYYTMALAVGNEGKDFMAANSFDATDLAIYKGKYITSVSAFINHSALEDSKDTHASIVIFEDGKLIREQQIENITYNNSNTVILDEPILVDATKELKIGLKIFDYDERQIPITYQNTQNFLPGKSDLYSEDGGKTWKKLSDFYAAIEGQEQNGYCCWDITANITDGETLNATEITTDRNLLAYNIFRNGEKINGGLIDSRESRFTDTKASDNSYYEVVAYYFDGSVSDVSNRFEIGELSSIHDLDADNGIRIYPNPATDYLNIAGNFTRATLLDINGQPVVETTQRSLSLTGFPSGVYFLRIECGDKVETQKIMVK